jgi:hypothetical protein
VAGLRRWKLTEGIALAVIPAVAYACAFLFELGYCHYLRIPAQFIAITTNDLVTSSLFVLASVLLVILLMELTSIFFHGTRIPVFRAILRILPLATLSAFVGILHKFLRPTWWCVVVGALVCLLLEFVGPVVEFRGIEHYVEKLAARERELEQRVSALGRLLGLVGYESVMIILSVLLFMAACLEWGRGEAASQKEFMIITSNPQRVILRIYGDTIISATLDTSGRHLGHDRFVEKLTGGHELAMTAKSIGPITLSEDENSP